VGRRHISLGGLIWLVIGAIVAANHHFFAHLDSGGRIGSAVLAVLVWPLVVLKVHIGI
jgi:apolipoprotein N-acyltransferase